MDDRLGDKIVFVVATVVLIWIAFQYSAATGTLICTVPFDAMVCR